MTQYNTAHKAHDSNKLTFNNVVYELARKRKIEGRCVVLDAPSLLTTKALVKAGFKQYNIKIPNNNREDFLKISKKHPHCCYFLDTLGGFLEKTRTLNSIKHAIFDYCGTLDGINDTNPIKNIKPIEDIKYLFDNEMLINDSILAVTICYRNCKKHKDIKYEDMLRLHKLVAEYAYINGYVAIPLNKGKIYTGMMYEFWNVLRLK